MTTLRVGIIGLGANTRLRHVPGLLACDDVQITAVCNRSLESTSAAAREFAIPHSFDRWQDLVVDKEVDAVVIGTWPILHCEATLAALAAGKHVLTEARMARNLAEARLMLAASRRCPELTTQIVPSPFGLRGDRIVRERLADGFLGELREVVVLGVNDAFADPNAPIHWRQVAEWNGQNILAMGILHETLTRWIPDPIRVDAVTDTFVQEREDSGTRQRVPVDLPDRACIRAEWADGARGIYHLSSAVHFGPGLQIHLYGTEGTLKYEFAPHERLWGGRRGEDAMQLIDLPSEQSSGWRVEEEFVNAIRGREPVRFTTFEAGVRYMAFTDAVWRSAQEGQPVDVE